MGELASRLVGRSHLGRPFGRSLLRLGRPVGRSLGRLACMRRSSPLGKECQHPGFVCHLRGGWMRLGMQRNLPLVSVVSGSEVASSSSLTLSEDNSNDVAPDIKPRRAWSALACLRMKQSGW